MDPVVTYFLKLLTCHMQNLGPSNVRGPDCNKEFMCFESTSITHKGVTRKFQIIRKKSKNSQIPMTKMPNH